MQNTFHYRFFLICNMLANKMLGMQPQNFAQLIVEEENGRFMNSQMTCFFYQADIFFSELINNNEGFMWDELDQEEIAKIPVKQLEEDFQQFCNGLISLDIRKEE